jgi:hypothetical protein
MLTNTFIPNIIDGIIVERKGGSLSLQFENNEAAIMSSRKQIEARVGSQEAKCDRVLVGKSGSMCVSSCPTHKLLSSPVERMSSCRGWNSAMNTLLKCPRHVWISQVLVSFILRSFTCQSSPQETIRGRLGGMQRSWRLARGPGGRTSQ